MSDEALAQKIFRVLDADRDGALSFTEFAAGVLLAFNDIIEERFLALFKEHDLDCDGALIPKEAECFLACVLPLLHEGTEESPQELLDGLQTKSGHIRCKDIYKRLVEQGHAV